MLYRHSLVSFKRSVSIYFLQQGILIGQSNIVGTLLFLVTSAECFIVSCIVISITVSHMILFSPPASTLYHKGQKAWQSKQDSLVKLNLLLQPYKEVYDIPDIIRWKDVEEDKMTKMHNVRGKKFHIYTTRGWYAIQSQLSFYTKHAYIGCVLYEACFYFYRTVLEYQYSNPKTGYSILFTWGCGLYARCG